MAGLHYKSITRLTNQPINTSINQSTNKSSDHTTSISLSLSPGSLTVEAVSLTRSWARSWTTTSRLAARLWMTGLMAESSVKLCTRTTPGQLQERCTGGWTVSESLMTVCGLARIQLEIRGQFYDDACSKATCSAKV